MVFNVTNLTILLYHVLRKRFLLFDFFYFQKYCTNYYTILQTAQNDVKGMVLIYECTSIAFFRSETASGLMVTCELGAGAFPLAGEAAGGAGFPPFFPPPGDGAPLGEGEEGSCISLTGSSGIHGHIKAKARAPQIFTSIMVSL